MRISDWSSDVCSSDLFEATRIIVGKPELGAAVISCCPEPAVSGCLDVPLLLGMVTAPLAFLADPGPLGIPALKITRDHPAGREETLADGSGALLRFAEGAAKLVGHVRKVRPVMPAIGLIVRHADIGQDIDQFLFHGLPSLQVL